MMEEKKEEKTLAEQLSEKLMIRRKNGFMRVTDEIIDTADAFCEGYKSFLDAAKTEREAVKTCLLYTSCRKGGAANSKRKDKDENRIKKEIQNSAGCNSDHSEPRAALCAQKVV